MSNENVCSIFLYPSKAFDTNYQQVLLQKLYRHGLRGVPLLWFKSMILKIEHTFLLTQLHELRSQLRGSFFVWFHFRCSYIIYFIYIYHIHLFHGNIWTHNWPAPNISGFMAQMFRSSHQYCEVTGSNPVEVRNLFFRLITQLHSLRSQLRGSYFIWFENTFLSLKNVKSNPLSNVMYLKFLLLAYFWFWYYN